MILNNTFQFVYAGKDEGLSYKDRDPSEHVRRH